MEAMSFSTCGRFELWGGGTGGRWDINLNGFQGGGLGLPAELEVWKVFSRTRVALQASSMSTVVMKGKSSTPVIDLVDPNTERCYWSRVRKVNRPCGGSLAPLRCAFSLFSEAGFR